MRYSVTCPRCGAAAEARGGSFLRCPECEATSAMPARVEVVDPEDEPVPLMAAAGGRGRRDQPSSGRPDREKRKSDGFSPIRVCVTMVLFLFVLSLVQGVIKNVRNAANPGRDDTQPVAIQRPAVPAPAGWKTFAIPTHGITLKAPVELDRVTPEGGVRSGGFTMHRYGGSDDDRDYQVITEVLDRPRAAPTSDRYVDELCDAIISKISRAQAVRRTAITVGGRPGRQLTFTFDDRHHLARVTYTGKHAYFWAVSAPDPLDPDDPLVAGFLDSAVLTD